MAKTDWKMSDTVHPDDMNEIGQEINDNVYGLSSHKSASILDHPDGSVTTAKIAPRAITQDRIGDKAVGSNQLAASAATDTVIGNRTIDDTQMAGGNTGPITDLFSWIANMIKAITGKSSWHTAPATTLEAASEHMNNKSNPHEVTKLQVGLGSVQDYGVATQAEAEAGTANTKYMTPLRTAQAINSLVKSGFKVSAQNVQVTSASQQTIVTGTPPKDGMFVAEVYFRVTNSATNVAVAVTYTDSGGAQTIVLMPSQSFAAGSYALPIFTFESKAETAMSVLITTSNANAVYVTATLKDG